MKCFCTLLAVALLSPGLQAAEAESGYQVVFTGTLSRGLRSTLKEASLAVGLRSAGSVSPRLLRGRARTDLDRFAEILRDRGHYGFEQRFDVGTDKKGVRLSFHIDPGPPYTLGAISIQGAPEGFTPVAPPFGEALSARSAEINRAGKERITQLKNAGYPWATLTRTRVIPDHARKSVAVEFDVTPRGRARLGTVRLSGLDRVSPDYIRAKVPVESGAWFREDVLLGMRNKLVGTGLFSEVLVRPAPGEEQVDILAELYERKFRSVFAGLSYQTDRGAGITGGFEHLNLLGRGERGSTELSADEVKRAWKNRLSKPDFLVESQTLVLKLDASREDTDAYLSSSLTTGVALHRKLGKLNRGGIGADLRSSAITQADEDRDFFLYLFPMELERNTGNDLLDPTRGYRVLWQGAPYFNVYAEDVFFVKNRVSWRQYLALNEPAKLTLAGRLALGTISGSALLDVPADERFYAGGGGSLRGYAYQTAGTLDEDGHPVGGRSLLETSLEVRARIYKEIGITMFWDTGLAGDTALPGEGGSLFHGVGAGLRYHTPIGPIRVDVGFPLQRRDGTDKRAQIYLSIGQAF